MYTFVRAGVHRDENGNVDRFLSYAFIEKYAVCDECTNPGYYDYESFSFDKNEREDYDVCIFMDLAEDFGNGFLKFRYSWLGDDIQLKGYIRNNVKKGYDDFQFFKS